MTTASNSNRVRPAEVFCLEFVRSLNGRSFASMAPFLLRDDPPPVSRLTHDADDCVRADKFRRYMRACGGSPLVARAAASLFREESDTWEPESLAALAVCAMIATPPDDPLLYGFEMLLCAGSQAAELYAHGAFVDALAIYAPHVLECRKLGRELGARVRTHAHTLLNALVAHEHSVPFVLGLLEDDGFAAAAAPMLQVGYGGYVNCAQFWVRYARTLREEGDAAAAAGHLQLSRALLEAVRFNA